MRFAQWRLDAAVLCLASLPAAVAAHHSTAEFDYSKQLTIEGKVKEVQWTNPHVWIQVVVDNNGQKIDWSIEGGSPNSLSRNGWKATTFKSGDPVVVRVNPMKDGTPGGSFIGAKWKDTGKTIGRWE